MITVPATEGTRIIAICKLAAKGRSPALVGGASPAVEDRAIRQVDVGLRSRSGGILTVRNRLPGKFSFTQTKLPRRNERKG